MIFFGATTANAATYKVTTTLALNATAATGFQHSTCGHSALRLDIQHIPIDIRFATPDFDSGYSCYS